MWRDMRAATRSDLVVPEVVAERCVHALMEMASCRACVDACPRTAWLIDEEMLGIDAGKCDGCDLCVPACPQGAIEGRFSPSLKVTDQGAVAFAACEHAGVEKIDEGLMPCLHSLAATGLLRLVRDGVSFLVTSCGDCGRCQRGGSIRMEQRLEEVNRLLTSRGMEPLQHRDLAADVWAETFRRIHELSGERTLDRRAFFRSAVSVPKERVEAAIEGVTSTFVPPGMLLETGAADALFPYVPAIDKERCNGCYACARLCPQEAILFDAEDHGAPAFLIYAERCSGCGICADVCEQDAVTVKHLDRSIERQIPLRAARCSACGIEFHTPASPAHSERLCWVCGKSNHYRTLYQVLD